MKTLSEEQARRKLKSVIAQFPTQNAFAQHCGISRSFLTRMLQGKKAISSRVLRVLGLRRVVRYEVLYEVMEEHGDENQRAN